MGTTSKGVHYDDQWQTWLPWIKTTNKENVSGVGGGPSTIYDWRESRGSNVTGKSDFGGALGQMDSNPLNPFYSSVQEARAKEEEREETKNEVLDQLKTLFGGLQVPWS